LSGAAAGELTNAGGRFGEGRMAGHPQCVRVAGRLDLGHGHPAGQHALQIGH
jgi:hypothetical protein